MVDIKTIRNYIENKNIYWTEHCLYRLDKRNISLKSVKKAINNGKIIEYYENDYPYPSCLILGKDSYNRVLHIVCGISKECVYIITAYYPDYNLWEDDLKIRRKK